MFNHDSPTEQQGDSEIAEKPVSQKKYFEKMFNVKENLQNNTPGTETPYSLGCPIVQILT